MDERTHSIEVEVDIETDEGAAVIRLLPLGATVNCAFSISIGITLGTGFVG